MSLIDNVQWFYGSCFHRLWLGYGKAKNNTQTHFNTKVKAFTNFGFSLN
jgi:hypothetical protein